MRLRLHTLKTRWSLNPRPYTLSQIQIPNREVRRPTKGLRILIKEALKADSLKPMRLWTLGTWDELTAFTDVSKAKD